MEKVGVWIVDDSHLRLISERFVVHRLSTIVHRNLAIEHPRGVYRGRHPHKCSSSPQRCAGRDDVFSTRCPHL